jgi:hypothetical protein
MKNKVLSYLLGWVFAVLLGFWWLHGSYVNAVDCSQPCTDGVKLNTCFPIIWNCIKSEKATGAFPTMMWALAKIIVSLILVVCFILIIYAGILWSMDKPKDAKEWIKRVAITILLLWFSWVILRLVNPNFFG